MSGDRIRALPPHRRDHLYEQIRRIVEDHEAADRALAGVGECLGSDEPLEAIIELVEAEVPASTTTRNKVAAG